MRRAAPLLVCLCVACSVGATDTGFGGAATFSGSGASGESDGESDEGTDEGLHDGDGGETGEVDTTNGTTSTESSDDGADSLDGDGGSDETTDDGGDETSDGGSSGTDETEGGGDETDTGQMGAGCDMGAVTEIETTHQSVIFPGVLRHPGSTVQDPYPAIYLLLPADTCSLEIEVDPMSAYDDVSAVLYDEDDVAIQGSACQAQDGNPCLVEYADGPGYATVVRLELQDDNDDDLLAFDLRVRATTEGLVDELMVESAFRSISATNYVLWPVGPDTGAYSYDWSTPTQTIYSAGVIQPNGALTLSLHTLSPSVGSWPKSGNPQGWYMLGTSTSQANGNGDAWTLSIQP